MARTDIAGLLTGISSGGIDPVTAGSAEQQRLAFGAQRAQGVRRGLLGAMGKDASTTSEKLQMAMAQLDMSNPDDLRKIAQIQQATGDLAGAAQTAARIQAMTTAKAQEDRAERGLKIREEQLAMQKTAAGEAKEREDKLNAQQGELRKLYVNEAINKGKPELAEKIKIGMDLETAGTLLTKTSTAQIKPVTGDEKDAYDKILYTPAMQKLLPKALTKGWHKGPLNDATENAIFLKTKEIATREQLGIEIAMVKAIDALVKLEDVPPDEEEKRKVDKRGRPLPDSAPPSQTDDPFGNI